MAQICKSWIEPTPESCSRYERTRIMSTLRGTASSAISTASPGEAVDMALDAVPRNVDIIRVRSYLEQLSGVGSIHDLHIWAMSTTETALTAHLVMNDPDIGNTFLDDL